MFIYKGEQNYSLSFMTYMARVEHKNGQLREELRKLRDTSVIFKFKLNQWF